MGCLHLDKISPEFRNLVDLLCFTERLDINLSNFYDLLQSNRKIHLEYFIERFHSSCEIYWQNAEQLWLHRISLLLSLNDKFISRHIEKFIEGRMIGLIKTKQKISPKYDVIYVQFLAYIKVKCFRKENLNNIKNYFIELSSQVKADKLIQIIYSLIPYLFKDINEYVSLISKNIIRSARNFEILQELEKGGVCFDKQPMLHLASTIMLTSQTGYKPIRAFFAIINDPTILKQIKQNYIIDYRQNLVSLLSNADYQILEEQHFRNVKNILMIDPVIADNIALIYTEKLYLRHSDHRKANADRLIRLMKMYPQISSKKILVWLSNHNKMSDIKYILLSFPSLRKLAAFV